MGWVEFENKKMLNSNLHLFTAWSQGHFCVLKAGNRQHITAHDLKKTTRRLKEGEGGDDGDESWFKPSFDDTTGLLLITA